MHHTCRHHTRAARRVIIVLLGLLVGTTGTGRAAPDHGQAAAGSDGLALQAKDLAARAELEAKVDAISQQPDLARKVENLGRHRSIFCNACHGKDGNSVRPDVPNLAGQNPTYLLEQFQRFGDGRRYDFAMSALAGSLSDEEKVLLALYYARMHVRPSGGGTPEQIAKGRAIYTKICTACHGKTGRGEKGYARLAGQRPTYVINMLKGVRDTPGRRNNPWMTAIVGKLSDADMTDVAYYIANMK
jgi:cytochrome c553